MHRHRLSLMLTLVAAAALLTAGCGGGGGSVDIETLATRAADQAASASQQLTASGVKFDKNTLLVPAGQNVSVRLDNQDAGQMHNFAVYRDKEVGENLFRGELFAGKSAKDFSFQAPAAGIYYFRCDTHPDMNGVFIAK
jgi:plastocyanin